MKKLVSLLLVFMMMFTMAGCSSDKGMEAAINNEPAAEPAATEPVATEPAATEIVAVDPSTLEHANVSVYVTSAGEKFISFNESTPFTAPDGITYKKGDLLPTWTHIEKALNLSVVDKTPKSGSDEKLLLEQAASTKFEDANLFLGSPRKLSEYGIDGYFLPLNDHFDKMPNFKKFLDENPSVEVALTQADGNIYLTPYFDDLDELERMFLMRIDWVQKILDEEAPAFDKTRTIKPVYKPVFDYAGGKAIQIGKDNLKSFPISKNIINIQNELSTLNGETLAQSLRDYIDANYMNAETGYTKRSELFTSSNAAYDADELIALMRAVKTNSVYLTGEDKDLMIAYSRKVKDFEKIRFIAAMWGVRGVDSKNGYYYLDSNNQVVDARTDDAYLTGLENLNKLYQEGLLLADFDQAKGQTSDFRSLSFQTNDGFLTYDYAASTVALHDLIPVEDKEKYGTIFEPVVSPAAQWFGTEFEHYAESNRSLKTEGGWGVTVHTKGAELDAALRLMDYPYSKEGLEVMSFGPKGLYWNDYMEFNGKQVPKLEAQFMADRDTYANGNWSNFMRGFIGATFGVGHVKQTIALETQVSNAHYAIGIERLGASTTALASLSSDVAPERRIMPTLLPLNEDQLEAKSVNTYGTYYTEWQTRIIKYGFGAKIPNSADVVPTREQFVQELKDKGIEIDVKLMNQAYDTVK
ncbi:hypothetical protein [Fusibacter sp. 3D3]|uniref:hypothetical protein n=1 Tax=Fusibacter sp. 3D3 TaxID=1048380 RepID=UPI0008536563|nr:hypothetical protein [Fusibacter sp. 3D3]GAU75740.1 ABC transporter, substrate-binding protein [Fusibacter sp. 3D3]